MRTQDIRLVASRATHEARAAERLARALHGIGASRSAPGSPLPSSNPPHVVFVDSAPQVRRFDPVRHFGTPAELLERHYNRPRLLPAPGSGAAAAAPRQTPLVAFPRGARPDRAAMKADKQRLASYAELARRRRQDAGALWEREGAAAVGPGVPARDGGGQRRARGEGEGVQVGESEEEVEEGERGGWAVL